jgi:hypothetical protein
VKQELVTFPEHLSEDNTMARRKRKNNDLQNNTQKTRD